MRRSAAAEGAGALAADPQSGDPGGVPVVVVVNLPGPRTRVAGGAVAPASGAGARVAGSAPSLVPHADAQRAAEVNSVAIVTRLLPEKDALAADGIVCDAARLPERLGCGNRFI
jgi:hypothetical protein